MNIRSFHCNEKQTESLKVFDAEGKIVNAIQILADQELKEQSTPVPAFLICISGKVQYLDNKGALENLEQGDFVQISPLTKFRLFGKENSNLLFIK